MPVASPSRSRPRVDVFAHLPGRHDETGGAQFVMQLGVDQVHLAQVRLGRIARHPRSMLDRAAQMRVVLDAETGQQPDAADVRLAERASDCG